MPAYLFRKKYGVCDCSPVDGIWTSINLHNLVGGGREKRFGAK